MFFPIIAVVSFLLSRSTWMYKIAGIAATSLVLFFYVQHQKNLNEELARTRVFCGFSGWQIANNALYCYKKIDIDPNDLPSTRLQMIDQRVRMYIDSLPSTPGEIGVQYLWDRHSPLKVYCLQVTYFAHLNYAPAWVAVSKDYGEYGWYIVKKFPGAFFRYYICPNIVKFFYPDLEALGEYNSSGMTTLSAETRQWFTPAIDHLECRFPGFQKSLLSVFPFLSLLLNVFNIAVLLFCFFRMVTAKKMISKDVRYFFFVWALFYCSFMAFSIFATPVNLRFMDAIFILGIIIPVALLSNFRVEAKEIG